MKLRLNSRYLLFDRCIAYGTTAGVQWWVVLLVSHKTDYMTIVFLPSEEVMAQQPRGLLYGYEYQLSGKTERVSLNSVRYLWLGPNGYPDCMREAVHFTVVTPYISRGNQLEPGVYLVDRKWRPNGRDVGRRAKLGTYDPWFDKYKLTFDEAVICSTHTAKLVCTYLAAEAQRRRDR